VSYLPEMLDWVCGGLDFEDGSTAPFSAFALEPPAPPWYSVPMSDLVSPMTALALLSAIPEPMPLPTLGPIITPHEPPEEDE
jgi:hypothetical protein